MILERQYHAMSKSPPNELDPVTIMQHVCSDPNFDLEKFRPLFDAYCPRLFAYFRCRLPDESDAEDLTSDVFLRIWERRCQFKGNQLSEFEGWMFTIARNMFNDFCSSRTRHPEGKLPRFSPNTSSGVEKRIIAEVQERRLKESIKDLTSGEQELLRLRFEVGLNASQIAQVLNGGITAETIRKRLSRLYEKLRKMNIWEEK